MLRHALLVAALLCVLVVSDVNSQGLRDSILTGAQRCCSSSCSAQERAQIDDQLLQYTFEGHADARAVRAAANAGCSSVHAKRTASGTGRVTCPYGPYDVANGPVKFTCNCMLSDPSARTGFNYGYIYATMYANGTSSTIYPDNYYYSDSSMMNKTIDKNVTFTLPQYARAGNYTVQCYAYGAYGNATDASASVSLTGAFNVAKTMNDMEPPKLTGIMAPVMNVNDADRSITISATDDRSGVRSIQCSWGNSTTTMGYAYWYAPYVNNAYVGQTSLSTALQFNNYSVIVEGVYDILYCYLYDALDMSSYYSTAQIKAMGFSSQIIFASGNCPSGRKLGYGETGRCTLCDKGTFSPKGAFRCKACLAGSASNVAGATSCTQCPPGTSGIGGSAGCDICPAGTYSSTWGASDCQPCAPGTTSLEGSEYCNSCPAGTYSATGGLATCTPCPAGTSSSGGAYFCNPCTPGTYMSATSASQCLTCPAGQFSWVGEATCQKCPVATPNGPAGSNSRLNCY